ncbi:putative HicB family RNase H-like nuclease [Herbiconiux flava]|uniref:Putative HicB family RNase H-like nuclease n=1 Tax=Herbiconiux flava TaxID=881268 RepID=A0A852SP60_9MICO|nr:putative HicB family RNase H-like nuclease [Herbiconiux flava]GLK17317.1 hypothetical protein GCM10017602_17990 [Herbiconiux flava]
MHCQNAAWHTDRVPNQPKTPMRGFRIPTDLYKAAQAKAASEGRSVTDIVREALASYVGDGSATRTSNR